MYSTVFLVTVADVLFLSDIREYYLDIATGFADVAFEVYNECVADELAGAYAAEDKKRRFSSVALRA